MSKNINVNPDHYKVAGRERQGENLTQSKDKRVLRETEIRAHLEKNRRKGKTKTK